MALDPPIDAGASWSDPEQVRWYVERISRLEARQQGERVLVDLLPEAPERVLDLGCGDGVLAALALAHRPSVAEVVAVDSSPPMLERARERFAQEPRVDLRRGDLRDPITGLGPFDLIVSGFAIHHLEDHRKRALLAECAAQLRPGGRFLNLEVVASATPARHAEFLAAIGRHVDDPEDRLASVEDQVRWMADAGLADVDCLWRWRGFALLVGDAPSSAP
ncbi:MAG: class I SAM-dependent methyltransferase [Actinobacteria bacterium]|nr:class I SAM-dependent methyltransferase [Actinomycetota bacterium]